MLPGGSLKKVGAFNFEGNTPVGAFRNSPTFGHFGRNTPVGDFPKVAVFTNTLTGVFGLFQKSWCVPGNAPTHSYY